MPNWPWKSRKQSTHTRTAMFWQGLDQHPRCCRWSDKATPQPSANTSDTRDHMQIGTSLSLSLALARPHSLTQHSAWSRASVRLIAGVSAADSDSDSNSVLGGTFGINTSASELSSTFVISILLQATRRAICSVKGLFAQLYRRSWYSSQYTRAQHVPENICASDF